MGEPLGHFLDRLAVGVPEGVAGGEKYGERRGERFVVHAVQSPIFGTGGQAVQLLTIELNLLLYEGPGRIELRLEVVIGARDRINVRVLDCAILEAMRAFCFQIPVQVVLNVGRVVCEVTQTERYVNPMALLQLVVEALLVGLLDVEPLVRALRERVEFEVFARVLRIATARCLPGEER